MSTIDAPHWTFQILNALVDDRRIAELSGVEFKVLMVHIRHADAAGASYPSVDTIGAAIGVDTRQVRRARASLREKGFLVQDDASGGRTKSAIYSVRVVKKTLVNKTMDKETMVSFPQKEGVFVPKKGVVSTPRSTHEVPMKYTDAAHGAAEGGAFGVEEGANRAVEGATIDPAASPSTPPASQSRRQPKAASVYPPGFLRFWASYPPKRKIDKDQCAAKWRTLGCEDIASVVLAALEAWKKSGDWVKENGQYVYAPHKWLNLRRWETVPFSPSKPTTASTSNMAGYKKIEGEAQRRVEAEIERKTKTNDLVAGGAT